MLSILFFLFFASSASAIDPLCTTTANLSMHRCPAGSTDWFTSYTDIVDQLDSLGNTAPSTFTINGNAFLVGASTLSVTSGRVGIGTVAPASKLHMSSGTLIVDGNAPLSFQIGASTLVVTSDGHFTVGGSSMPALSACGTGPKMVNGSSDHRGALTTGSATGTICTLTFKTAYSSTPFCIVLDRTSGLTSPAWVESTIALSMTGLISSDNYSYVCEGQ